MGGPPSSPLAARGCQESLVTPGRSCWTHRRSLGARGPRGLRGTCTGRREGRAGLSILLGERRPPPLNGPFPQFLFDPRAQGIHGHQGPGSLQTHPWEAGGGGGRTWSWVPSPPAAWHKPPTGLPLSLPCRPPAWPSPMWAPRGVGEDPCPQLCPQKRAVALSTWKQPPLGLGASRPAPACLASGPPGHTSSRPELRL